VSTFVDTSAFVALLNADDSFHEAAVATWERLADAEEPLVTSSYVVVETNALVQRRLGMDALRAFSDDVVRAVQVAWVGREVHEAATSAQMLAGRRHLSLVDCASFLVMRHLGLTEVFAFDDHFRDQGFRVIRR